MATLAGPPKTKDQPTTSHLLRLPRGLRDRIYDYVTVNAEGLNLRIQMSKGSKPEKIVFALDGLARASSQLKTEYFAALECRMKGLMGKEDLLGLHLAGRSWMQKSILDRKSRLYVSRTLHPDGSVAQNVHKLTVPVQLSTKSTGDSAQFCTAGSGGSCGHGLVHS